MNRQFDVVGLGVSTLDMFTVVDAFPTTREVKQASAMVVDGGGPVATALATLGRLGIRTAMIDCLGDDWTGDLILRDFAAYGVDTSCIQLLSGSTSSVANILVEQATGARAILFQPGTAAALPDIAQYENIICLAKVLHVNGRHEAACLQAMDIARRAGVKVSFDGGANRYRPIMRSIVPLADICIVARDFAEQYTKHSCIEAAAAALQAEGPGLVVITDGVNGSWVLAKGEVVFQQAAYTMDRVVDSTGCGDSYHGGFIYGWLTGMTIAEAAQFASAVAALNTQTLGGRQGLPHLSQVKQFLANR